MSSDTGAPAFNFSEPLAFAKQFWAGFQPMSHLPGLAPAAPAGLGGLSPLQHMAQQFTPTLDLESLDKRLQDLKSVEQWLELNLSMLRTTIQTMEVQRGTLVALRSFSETLQQSGAAVTANLATDLAANTSTSNAPSATPDAQNTEAVAADSAPTANSEPATNATLNPAHWWQLLQDQFAQLAGATLAQQVQTKAEDAPVTSTSAEGGSQRATKKTAKVRRANTRKNTASDAPSTPHKNKRTAARSTSDTTKHKTPQAKAGLRRNTKKPTS